MTNRRRRLLLLLLLLAGGGCSRRDTAAPELAAEINANPTLYSPRLPGYDVAATIRRLQGTWVFGGSTGEPFVWSIAGDRVTQSDAAGAITTGRIDVTRPCEVMMVFPDGSAEGHAFTFEGDTLYLGTGKAGAIVGTTMYSCASVLLVRKRAGHACEEETGGTGRPGQMEYTWKPVDCTATPMTLTVPDGSGNPVTLQIAGTALYDDEMKQQVARKVDDLAAGIAAQADLRRALEEDEP